MQEQLFVLILEDYFLSAVDFESKNSQSSDNPIVCKDILLEHAHSFSLILLLAVNSQWLVYQVPCL